MTTNDLSGNFAQPVATGTRPELLVSTVLHLMSHYSANSQDAAPCVKLAAVIERHLKALAELPDLAPVLRATCEQLSEQWSGVVERTMPKQKRHHFLTRFIKPEQ